MNGRDDTGSSRSDRAGIGGKARDAFYNRSAATPSNAIEIPKIELPQGGGALKGIDEKFTVNAANGTAGIRVPLPFTASRGAPSIALGYNSGSGNGCFGIGWAIDLPAIQRRTDKQLPRYFDADESDVFMLAGAEDLVPALRDDGTPLEIALHGFRIKRYRPRIEVGFARIEQVWRDGEPTFYWKVTTRDNSVTFYGLTAAGRLADPDDPRKVARWLPELGFDDKGTVVVYQYKREDGAQGPAGIHDRNRYDDQGKPRFVNCYLKRIRYGNREPWYPAHTTGPGDSQSLYAPSLATIEATIAFSMELVLDYGEHGAGIAPGATQATIPYDEQVAWPARVDACSDFRYGFDVRTLRLCRRILMFHRFDELGPTPTLVRSLDLHYASSPPGTAQPAEVTHLVSATSRGYTRRADDLYDFTAVPSATFAYQPLCWDSTVHEIAPGNAVHAPEGIGGDYQWVDLWGEGIHGILTEQAGELYYESNLGGGRFTAAQVVAPKPSIRGLSLQDLDADGSRQLVSRTRELAGYFELNDEQRWQPFRAFPSIPALDVSAPNVLQLDLDGDGIADLLVAEECAMRWYPSRGRNGHGEPQRVPRADDDEQGPVQIYSDPIQRIFLADMSGDGLSDVVRIRNGEICYWPNLGYGRFGAKITMDGSPIFASPEQFDPRYLQLVDVTGTGATDLLYLNEEHTTVWLNLSGNGWSAPQTVALPETARPIRVTCNDFLGRGTLCLVWSSPLPGHAYAPLRYIDLLDGKKPHVLVGYDNGIGKRISLTYRTSTEFYLDDKRAGKSWKTRLPFPVHCVARVETNELVTDAVLVQEYTYHHGYYDHVEREFRGFARVDVRDTESFSRWVRQDASNLLDEGFHQPVVLTRTWYHTGALAEGGDPLAIFAADYWTATPELLAAPGVHVTVEPALPGAELPPDLEPTELREAVRACKGLTLRREIFALDAPEQDATDAQRVAQLTPFSVSTHNCAVRRLQARGANRYGVFTSHQSEALELIYERNPADARISHTLTLEVDAYGNALKSVAAVYGRQLGAPPVGTPEKVWTAQKQIHLTLTETRMTVDDLTSGAMVYRLPVTCETRMFELTGVTVPPAGTLLQIAALRSACTSAVELGYEQVAPADPQLRKRLIEAKRALFLGDDLVSPRPFGNQSPLGLAFESYQLAMTGPVVRTLFPADKVADADLETWFGDQAKYVHFDDRHGTSDAGWWIRSGTSDYLDSATAPKRFYQPAAYIDARGARTSVYCLGEDETRANTSAHWQLVARRKDGVGNETRVLAYDFRSLKPLEVQDLNGNLTELVLDDLGRVVAMAVMGKGSEADRLDSLKALLGNRAAQSAAVQQFLTQGDTGSATWLLQDATTRWVYDDVSIPRCSAHIARERHVADLQQTGDALKLQFAFEYTGGAGNVVMKKAQAAPGDAWTTDAQTQRVLVHNANPRWVGSGRTVFNNKGQPVKQYEPYYSTTHRYETDRALTDVGVSPIHMYDALDRHLRTDFPDGTYGYTRFDAWSQQVFDGNDTVKSSRWYAARMALAPNDPQRVAAQQTELHDGTPLTVYLDSLGRSMCSVAHNRGKNGTGIIEETFLHITATLDIEGNVLSVTDPRRNTIMEHRYDLLGRPLYRTSSDAGERWVLQDVTGATLYSWDSRMQRMRSVYDAVGRPVEQWLSIGGADEILLGRTIWGEFAPDPELHNLRGHAWKTYEQSGCVAIVACDFKGNVLESHRRFATVYDRAIAWPAADPDQALEQEAFRTRTVYDALGRPRQAFSPDSSTVTASELLPSYDESGLLVRVDAKLRGAADATPFVTSIRYDAKGQRLSIAYGNGTSTTYEYDPDTFRLSHLVTTRPTGPGLQDLSWVYDPAANVISMADAAQQTTYFNSVPVAASQHFEYDALYRLTSAQGREQIGQNLPTDPWDGSRTRRILPEDAQAMQPYEERYEYDLAGNLTKMIHGAGNGGSFVNRWTRASTYDDKSNRLLASEVGDTVVAYTHNPHGSLTTMPHLQVMEWNSAEHLHHIKQGTTDAYYSYDPSGQRTRKVVVKQGGVREVRLYLGELEIFRRYRGDRLELERETQHVMDGVRRIALVETRTSGDDGSPIQSYRFQLSNHLGSACVETDEHADVVTYEEYFPHGSTSWQAGRSSVDVVLKRYRYCGLERDEESGLGYHGARYYAPWLGRWSSADPDGIDDGLNVYAYVSGNPVALKDLTGTSECDPNMATCDPDKDVSNVYEDSVQNKEQTSSEAGNFIDQNRYNMAILHEAVRTKTVIKQPFDFKKQADTALKNTQTPEHKANQAIALLSSYPLAPERTLWNRGGSTLLMGGGMVVLGVGGIFTGGGTWFLLGAALTTAGGVAGVGVGGVQLATSGTRTYQQDAEINRATDTMYVLSTPSSLLGGTAGLLIYGNEEGLYKGAAAAGIADLGLSLGARGAAWAYINNPYSVRVNVLLPVEGVLLPTVTLVERSALELRARAIQYKLYTSGTLSLFEATRKSSIAIVDVGDAWIIAHQNEAAWLALINDELHLAPYEVVASQGPLRVGGKLVHSEILAAEEAAYWGYESGQVATYPRGCMACQHQLKLDFPGITHLNPGPK